MKSFLFHMVLVALREVPLISVNILFKSTKSSFFFNCQTKNRLSIFRAGWYTVLYQTFFQNALLRLPVNCFTWDKLTVEQLVGLTGGGGRFCCLYGLMFFKKNCPIFVIAECSKLLFSEVHGT